MGGLPFYFRLVNFREFLHLATGAQHLGRHLRLACGVWLEGHAEPVDREVVIELLETCINP